MASEETVSEGSERKRYKDAKAFILASFFVYILMMGSKNIFTAELVTLTGVFEATKAETSLAMTYYFITYATGQLILSFLMKRINLRLYLSVTAALSAVLTILLGISPTLKVIYALCAANGILQAGIFSGCMAALSRYLPVTLLTYSNRLMTVGTACWGVLSYGIPPLFVGKGLWNLPFFLLGGLFLVAAILFFITFGRIRQYPPREEESPAPAERGSYKPYFKLGTRRRMARYLGAVLAVVILNESMQYMIMNWIPNMLYDVFGISESYSILITLIVPVISAGGSILAINICEAPRRNVFSLSAAFTAISSIALLPMVFIFDRSAVLSVLLIAVFIAFAAGSRAIFAGVIAFKMQSQIDAGTFLAATNAVGSLSAAFIPPLAGLIIDSSAGASGYGMTYLIALLIGIVNIAAIMLFVVWYKREEVK